MLRFDRGGRRKEKLRQRPLPPSMGEGWDGGERRKTKITPTLVVLDTSIVYSRPAPLFYFPINVTPAFAAP